jgi:hypothetical protein
MKWPLKTILAFGTILKLLQEAQKVSKGWEILQININLLPWVCS